MADKKYRINFEMSDGTTKSVEFTSPQGKDGHTPERGVDYWTEEDKDEILGSILGYSENAVIDMIGIKEEALEAIGSKGDEVLDKIPEDYFDISYMAEEAMKKSEATEKKIPATVTYDEELSSLVIRDAEGNDLYDPVKILQGTGGGGGGGGATSTVTLTNKNGTSSMTVVPGKSVDLSFEFKSTENDVPTGNGICQITINGAVKSTLNIEQGPTTVDISKYLSNGTNTVRVKCTDVYGSYKTLVYTITLINIYITSTFDATVPYNGDITFKYIPYGAIDKTIHILVDGTEIATTAVSTSGKQITQIIPALSHGVHRLDVYATAELSEDDLESTHLVYDIMSVDSTNTSPMIASAYTIDKLKQGEQVSIPYIVYDPTTLACDITLDIYTMSNGSELVYSTQSLTVDRSEQHWNTRKYPIGTVYFRIKYGQINKIHSIEVSESGIDVEAETNDLELALLSDGRSNNEDNPDNWVYGDYSTTFTDFNWESNGWVYDDNGETCLRVNGDARAEIQFKPFSTDLRTYGKTLELEFAIRDVNARDDVVISCMSGGIGFEVKADTAYIVSEQSRVFCNYKDETKVKVTFTIESKSEYRQLSVFLNGVLSDVIQYPESDNFQQLNPVNITIGSSTCGVDLYTVRSYSTALAAPSNVNNFIADIDDIVMKTEVDERNDIYDEYGNISFEKCKGKNSTMVIVGDLPKSKGDKKTVKVVYYDIDDPSINYTDDTVGIDVQGTSSQFFVRKNWKLKFSEEHYIDKEHLPAKVICIKVDYAECTGTHNTQNANFVETLYSEPIPPQATEPKCRTTIYGKPILLFHQQDENSDPVFYGKSNKNYDKGAEGVFGFTDQYDVECWEFCNNTSDACNFLGEIPEVWKDDFEARYPEDYTNISRFKEMHDWVVSTKDDLNKFKMEFEDHFDMHYALIYYVYTFFALMVDQRAKNMFLTYWGSTGKWYPYFYDNDTSFGINNEGQLVLDYYHEDTDQIGGANVYNGQNSVLWTNFRQAFADEIQETYQSLRSSGLLTYDKLIERFITNGSDKWSESIYNEDSDFKYISMLRSDNDATNLPQVRGTGEEHFRYFVENRINYCDSKWYAADYADDIVSLRIYTPSAWAGVEPNADITATYFSDIYAGCRYKANGTLIQHRVANDTPVTFEAPDETFNDTETAVYGAHLLSSLGDLAPLYCGSVNVANAEKLIELKVGDATEGYSNTNLNELSVGTNKLLRKVDVRNCPNLSSAIDLSGCPSIEEVYATGTSITGVEFPAAGCLRIAHLPATVTNLTLKDQINIEELTFAGYDSMKTIRIENCPTVDALDILSKSTNVERVRLTDVDWEYDSVTELTALAARNLAGIDENGINIDKMWVDGKCHIKSLTGAEYAQVKMHFPYLDITYGSLSAVLTYMSEDGSVKLYEEAIVNGGDGVYAETNFTKPSTAQYDFTFGGWSLSPNSDPNPDALKSVKTDRTVYVAFTKSLRKYTVNFYNGTTLLETQTIEYGSDATYAGETPVHATLPDYMEFTGWKPEPTNIQGDTDCYAQWYDNREITDDWSTIAAACLDGTAVDKYVIGAYKPVDITYEDGTSETIPMEVIAHNHDELADGARKWELVDNSCIIASGQSTVYNNCFYAFRGKNLHKWDGTSWSIIDQSVPVDSDNMALIEYNNELHVLGGSTNLTAHYKWNETDGWTEVSTLPVKYDSYGKRAEVYNNELYITKERNALYKWNETDGWVKVVDLPANKPQTFPVSHNGELYIKCGDSLYKLDTVNSELILIATGLPSDSIYYKLISYDDKIYMFELRNSLLHYSWDGVEWIEASNITQLGYPNTPSCVEVLNNEIHLVSFQKHYKWSGASWESEETTLSQNSMSSNYVIYNNELHALSGSGSFKLVHTKFDGSEWSTVSTLPYDLYGACTVVLNGEIHILGGQIGNTNHYKWNGTEWTTVSTLPYAFYNGLAVVYDNDIHLLGSYTDGYRKSHYKWNETDGWMDLGELPANCYLYGRAIVHNTEIHMLGTAGNSHYKWDGVKWTQLDAPPIAPVYATSYNNEIHVAQNTSHYKWSDTDGWTKVGTLPYSTYDYGCMITFRSKLYLLRYNHNMYIYKNPRATLTFLAKNLLKDNRGMYKTAYDLSSWSGSDLRNWCNSTLFESLPNDLKESIKEVSKFSDGGYSNPSIIISTDKLWIPSYDESGCSSSDNNVEGQGECYPTFTDAKSRVRYKIGVDDAANWITRSSHLSAPGRIWYIMGNGGSQLVGSNNATMAILPGFCI